MGMKTIIEMAREAGAYIADLPLEDAVLFEVDILSGRSAKLERFAALVLANNPPDSSMAWQEGCEAGRRSEREACAKVCDDLAPSQRDFDRRFYDGCESAATAIRARGNK